MYSTFRNEILQSYSSSGLEHLSVAHPLKAFQNESLFTDYFYTPEKKSKCLVHLSGVHGVEGYLGSLIQRQILKEDFRHMPFQLVIVHSVNPYGMAAQQRTNAANVDLNRNSLSEYKIDNPNYEKFLTYFKSGKTLDFVKILPAILRMGLPQTVKTVACGQTEYPDALFFAGRELQPELRSLHESLRSLVDPKAHLYVLDVHTGLGKMGEESLILDGFGPDEEEIFFEKAFQQNPIWPGRTKGSYRADGTVSLLLKKHWSSFHLFQEFGTYPALQVLNALIHHKPEQLLESFFPQKESWRKRCIEMGLLRFRQLVQTLS